jgi:hypothetical protein
MFILTLFLLSYNAKSFVLQINRVNCVNGNGCQFAENIKWLECHGDSDLALTCHSNLNDVVRMENIHLRCESEKCDISLSMNYTPHNPVVVLIEFFLNHFVCVANLLTAGIGNLKYFDFYAYEKKPNAIMETPIITNPLPGELSLILDGLLPFICFACVGIIGVVFQLDRTYRLYKKHRLIDFALPEKIKLRDINVAKKYRKQLKKDSPDLYLIIDHFCRQFSSTKLQEMSLACEVKSRYTLQFYMNDGVVICDRELNALRNLYRQIERITLTSEEKLLLTMIVQK